MVMKKFALASFAFFLFCLLAINISASTITFDNSPSGWYPGMPDPEWDYDEYGLTLNQHAWWSGYGGGHLFMQNYLDDDYLIFDTPKYVKQFEINGLSTPGYQDPRTVLGPINIAAFDNNNNKIWNTSVDLTNYGDWNNWLTVSVETDNVSKLVFYDPWGDRNPWFPWYDEVGQPIPQGSYIFFPSIDNINIENSHPQVPEPGTMFLLGSLASGLFGFAGLKKRFIK